MLKLLAEEPGGAIQFSELGIEPADEWTQTQFIDHINPDFIVFLTALAAIAVFRMLTRL